MSNRAYLVASPWRRRDPSSAPRFDEDLHTVATAVARVPLLWVALFDANDLDDGTPVSAVAPALARLPAAVARLESLWPARGSLASHAEALTTAVRAARGKFVAIELDEIRELYARPSTFDASLRRALGYLYGARDVRAKPALSKLAELPGRGKFPSAIASKRSRADAAIMHGLLGTSHVRDVPWEPEPTRAPRACAPEINPGAALRDALSEGDVAAARSLLAAGADPSFSDHSGSTFEQVFYKNAPLTMLDELVAAGANLDAKQRIRGYPLVQAAAIGDPKLIRALLDRGVDVHVLDEFRRTALTVAVCQGHVEAVKVLLIAPMTEHELRAAIRWGMRRTGDGTESITERKQREKRVAVAVQLVTAKLAR